MQKLVFFFCLIFSTVQSFSQDTTIIQVQNLDTNKTILDKFSINQSVTPKKDTFYFTKPNILKNLGNVPSDVYGIFKSPFQGKNWIGLTAVSAATALLILTDQEATDFVVRNSISMGISQKNAYNSALRIGTANIIKIPQNLNAALYQLGEGGTSMMIAGGLIIYGKIKNDWRAEQTAYDLAETFVTMGVTTQILKRITGRESPTDATVNGGKWSPLPSFKEYQNNTPKYDAFPSGHLATMMATVTVLTTDYPEKKWIKPVGYSLIGLTGLAMMNSKVHWLSDYPLALAIGYLSGKITTMRNKKQHKPNARMVVI